MNYHACYVHASARKFWKVANLVPDVNEGLDRRDKGMTELSGSNVLHSRIWSRTDVSRGCNEREDINEQKESGPAVKTTCVKSNIGE